MRKIIIKLFASSWYIFLTYMYDARSHLHQKRYSFFNLGARLGWVVNAMPWPLYPQERSDTHYTGGCVGLRAGLDWCEKSRPTGIRSPDRQARRQSLYRLRYPAHK